MKPLRRALLSALLLLPGLAAAAEPATAFVNANVVTMSGEAGVLRGRTVLVQDGRIEAIGGPELVLPPDVRRIDAAGAWLSPGLADMHMHSDIADDLAVDLAHGVTTVLNLGGARNGFIQRTMPAANRGAIPAPQVFAAFVVDGTADYGHFQVHTPDEARAAVGLARANGYRFIKVYNNLQPEVFAALAAEGRRLGLPLVGHGVTAVGLAGQLEAGQAVVAHLEEFFYTFFWPPGTEQSDAPPPDDAIAGAVALMRQHPGAAVVADLVTYAAIAGQIGKPEVVAAYLSAPQVATLAPADRLAWRQSSYVHKSARLQARLAFLGRLARALADAGVPLLAGTDAPTIPGLFPGASLLDDLDLLEQAGLSRYQVLATATRTPGDFIASRLGVTPFGRVAVGMRADLLLTAANPLDGLATLRRPLGVMVGGQWRDAAALEALRAEVASHYVSDAAPPPR
jgi:imidazolonepropionase-like amidohydrolase